jgi:hypothetical protein
LSVLYYIGVFRVYGDRVVVLFVKICGLRVRHTETASTSEPRKALPATIPFASKKSVKLEISAMAPDFAVVLVFGFRYEARASGKSRKLLRRHSRYAFQGRPLEQLRVI